MAYNSLKEQLKAELDKFNFTEDKIRFLNQRRQELINSPNYKLIRSELQYNFNDYKESEFQIIESLIKKLEYLLLFEYKDFVWPCEKSIEDAFACKDLRQLTKKFGTLKQLKKVYESALKFAPDKSTCIKSWINHYETKIDHSDAVFFIESGYCRKILGQYKSNGYNLACHGVNPGLDSLERQFFVENDPFEFIPIANRIYIKYWILIEIAKGAALAFHVTSLKNELNELERNNNFQTEVNSNKNVLEISHRVVILAHNLKVKAGLEKEKIAADWKKERGERARQCSYTLLKNSKRFMAPTEKELKSVIEILNDYPTAQKIAINMLEQL